MELKTSKSLASVVRKIKRETRRKFNSEEKIRIILEGLKGEDCIAVICCREGIAHTRGRPYHPMIQGKIDRYHRSEKISYFSKIIIVPMN